MLNYDSLCGQTKGLNWVISPFSFLCCFGILFKILWFCLHPSFYVFTIETFAALNSCRHVFTWITGCLQDWNRLQLHCVFSVSVTAAAAAQLFTADVNIILQWNHIGDVFCHACTTVDNNAEIKGCRSQETTQSSSDKLYFNNPNTPSRLLVVRVSDSRG